MLENLAKSLNIAFKEHITTEMNNDYGEQLLVIELNGVELWIKENAELFAVSGVRLSRLKVDVDKSAASVPTSGASVAPGI